MADDDVENYVDSLVDKKLKKLGFSGDISALGGIGGGSRDTDTQRTPSHLKELIGEIKVVKELSDVTRGDLDKVISEGIKQKMAETIIPVLFGGNKSVGPWESFLVALGNKAGENMPALFDVVFNRLGKDGTDKVLDIIGEKMGGAGGEKENTIKSLDPDNPNHLHYYMSIRGLSGVSADDARKSLVAEKANLMEKEKMKGGSAGASPGMNPGISIELENTIREQNTYLEKIMNRQNQSDEVIKFLVEKIDKMEGEKRGVGDIRKESTGERESVDRECVEKESTEENIGKENIVEEDVLGENTENQNGDVVIANKISDSWEKDIEKNKEIIRKKNEEEKIKREEEEKLKREKEKEEEKLKREKEERERVVVIGKKRTKSNPVFENNVENNIEKEANI